MPGSVMPLKRRSCSGADVPQWAAKARSSARRPAPPADSSVPSTSKRTTVGRKLQPQLARDDRELDLRGSLRDGHQPRVAPVALDRELGDVAVAAVDLHRLPGHPLRDLGGEELRHGGFAHAGTAVEEPRRAPHRGAGRLDLHAHARQLELDGLELGDLLSELLALAGVAERRLERGLAHADRAGRVRDATALERAGHLLEPALDAAEERRRRDPQVLEGQRRRLGGVVPGLPELPRHVKARRPGVDHERADAGAALRPVGVRGDEAVVGDVAVGDEHLGAVDDVVVAVPLGGGPDGGGVGSRVRLGESPAAELLAAQRRHQELALLLLGPEAQQRNASQPDMREERGREAAVDACDLLDQQAAHHHVAAAAAVLLGIADAEITEASELAEQVERKGLGALELLDARPERALGEAADGGAKRLLFLVQGEAEHAESSARGPYQGDSIVATGARVTAQSANAPSHSTSGAARLVCRTSQSTRPGWTSNARGSSGNVTISPLRFSKSARRCPGSTPRGTRCRTSCDPTENPARFSLARIASRGFPERSSSNAARKRASCGPSIMYCP